MPTDQTPVEQETAEIETTPAGMVEVKAAESQVTEPIAEPKAVKPRKAGAAKSKTKSAKEARTRKKLKAVAAKTKASEVQSSKRKGKIARKA